MIKQKFKVDCEQPKRMVTLLLFLLEQNKISFQVSIFSYYTNIF